MKKVIGLAVLALFVSACDDSDSPSSAASPSPTPTATPGTSPEPTASPGPSASPMPTPTPEYGEKGACLVPVSPLATTSVETGMGCIACSVTDPDAVKTLRTDDKATMSALLSLLPVGGQSDVALTVDLLLEQNPNEIPMTEGGVDDEGNPVEPVALGPAPDTPGFIVSFPDPSLLAAGVLPELLIETLKGGEVVEDAAFGFGFGDGFALGSILQDINNAEVYLPVQATQPYDAIRVSLTGTVLNLLLDVDVHGACINGVGGSISGDF